MSILEEISQMQNQGQSNEEISATLKEKGVSPKEINDAINQAKIKSAIADQEYSTPQEDQQAYVPQTQEASEQQYAPQEAPYQQNSYQPQENYMEYPSGGLDTDTMVEIAEQVFQEKIAIIQKNVENLNDFKTMLNSTVNNLSERLKRIETTIDKLQLSILDKVGSYGENLNAIKKEMSMMQDSFGKMSNKIADNKMIKKLPKKISK